MQEVATVLLVIVVALVLLAGIFIVLRGSASEDDYQTYDGPKHPKH